MEEEKQARISVHSAGPDWTGMLGRVLSAAGSALDFLHDDSAFGRADEAMKGKGLKRLRDEARRLFDSQAPLRRVEELGLSLIAPEDEDYPESFHLVREPPPLLYVAGRLPDGPAVSLIGSRRATSYGLRQARRFGSVLAESGLCIVSGLARGIDAVAMKAAMDGGGCSVGIIGGGHARLYPPEHAKLAERICEKGAVLSEFPPDARPERYNFPWRNRLIAAMGRALIVIEAAQKSGTLSTVNWALDIGREVAAIPGSVDGGNSTGCHQLIRDGAHLVESPLDVLQLLELDTRLEVREERGKPPLKGLGTDPVTVDELLEANPQLSLPVLNRELIRLSVEGLILQHPGSRYSLP